MRRLVSFPVLLALVLCLVGCDHATKQIATARLRGQPPVTLIKGVADLRYVENRDVGFSLLRAVPEPVRKPLIFTIGLGGLALIALLWRQHRNGRVLEHVAFALILSGALGNLSDRLWHGHVVDFVHVTHWPVFNAADAWLVIGIGLLLITDWQKRRAAKQGAPVSAEAPAS